MNVWRWLTGQNEDEGGYFKIPGHHEYDGLILDGAKKVKHLEQIRDVMEFKADDVISVGFPKSGQTWVNEIVYQILHKGDEKALMTKCHDKWIFLELSMPPFNPGVRKVANSPSPRHIKSHLPARYFARCCGENAPKIIVPMRNPKDTLVSLYHFYRMNKALGSYTGTWDEFFELHTNNRLFYENIFKYNAGWFERREESNVCIVKYEDLQKNPKEELRRLSTFLEKSLTEKELDCIVEATSMENMSTNKYMKPEIPMMNEKVSKFFRKGKVGDWENYFSPEQNEYIEKEYKEMAEAIGLTFDFTI